MNEQQYGRYVAIYGSNFAKYNKWVDPDELLQFDQKARIKGDLQTNIQRYAGQFLNGVSQKTPISVVPIPGSSGYRVVDGVTRGRAKQIAKNDDSAQKVYVNTFCHEVLNFTSEQWEDFQDSANDHLGAQSSTEDDIKGAVQRRIKSGRLDVIVKAENGGLRLDPTDPQEVRKYAELGGKWFVREIFPNCGKGWVCFKNEIVRSLSCSVKYVKKIKTHTDKDLQKMYVDLGRTPYDLTGGVFNKISNNEAVFVVRNNNRINPNLYGSLIHHLLNNPSVDYTVMINYNRVLTKGDSEISSDRNEVVSSVKSMLSLLPKLSLRITVKSVEQIDSDPAGFQTLWDSRAASGQRLSVVGAA
jgi:hypothetical protein